MEKKEASGLLGCQLRSWHELRQGPRRRVLRNHYFTVLGKLRWVGGLGDRAWENLSAGHATSPGRWLLKPCAFTQARVYPLQSMDQGPASNNQKLLDMYSVILDGSVFFSGKIYASSKGVCDSKNG